MAIEEETLGFSDPVVRCLSCGQLLFVKTIKQLGYCHKCGNKRVTCVQTLNDAEMEKLKAEGVNSVWLDEFEEVASVHIIK